MSEYQKIELIIEKHEPLKSELKKFRKNFKSCIRDLLDELSLGESKLKNRECKSFLISIENDKRNCINFKLKLKTYKHQECSYLNR